MQQQLSRLLAENTAAMLENLQAFRRQLSRLTLSFLAFLRFLPGFLVHAAAATAAAAAAAASASAAASAACFSYC